MEKLIDGEVAYPIYKMECSWTIILGDGKPIDDGTSFYKMFKQEQSEEELAEFAANWWKNFCERRDIAGVHNLTMNFRYLRHETWVLTWFSHETFDVGQSDEEALASFERYVNRMMPQQDFCLMGAEDRWRWRGAEDNAAPCRCSGCVNRVPGSTPKTPAMEILTSSVITCPHCGFQKEETMPTDACQYFYPCTNCATVLKPKQGDCCVFCSYGTVKCPPVQSDNPCCSRGLLRINH